MNKLIVPRQSYKPTNNIEAVNVSSKPYSDTTPRIHEKYFALNLFWCSDLIKDENVIIYV